MERTRVKLAVYVDLDPVPGVFNTAESAQRTIAGMLQGRIPHYRPEVQVESSDIEKDKREEMKEKSEE